MLDVNFTVENVSGFEICAQLYSPTHGHTASKITCTGLVGFTFRNTSHVTVQGLTFNSCAKEAIGYCSICERTDSEYLTVYGMSIVLGKNMEISNCSFQDSAGTALGVFYSSLNLKGSNSFTNNCRGCSNRNHTCTCLGGGMFTNNSTLFVTGNTTFRDNTAEYGGGISAHSSTLHYTGNSTFRNNIAAYGGGINALNSTLNFNGICTVRDSSAVQFGGGINTKNSTLNFNGNCTFSNNFAVYGGGIHALNSTLNFTGNSEFGKTSAKYFGGGIYSRFSTLGFTGNSDVWGNSASDGGGIYAFHSALNFTGNSAFTHNSVAGFGGGILAWYSTLNFTGNNTFRNNLARIGGEINAWRSTVSFTGNTTSRNNSAMVSGGGLNVVNSTLNFIGHSTFRSNSAERSGGGICAWNSTLNFTGCNTFRSNSGTYGGGMNIYSSYLSCMGENTFRKNSANLYGGGINGWNSTLNFAGKTTFRNNPAAHGGGINAGKNSTLNLTGIVAFGGNIATHGGGINALASTLNFRGFITFTNNSAASYGGGINAKVTILNVNTAGKGAGGNIGKVIEPTCYVLFADNSALIHGGAVYTEDSTLIFERLSVFSGNSVQYYGGGLYSENSTLKFSGSTSFSSNTGQLKGGGLYGVGTFLYFNGNASFTANVAAKGGGQYLVNSFNFLSRNTTFLMVSNNATEYGGAVYAADSNPASYCFPSISKLEKCFFQIHGLFDVQVSYTWSDLIPAIISYFNIHLHLYNNNAQTAGSAVYGGSLDSCTITVDYKVIGSSGTIPSHVFTSIMELEPHSTSSNPFQVCPCDDGIPYCNASELARQVHPGEVLRLSAVATGQRDGIVPAVVRAMFRDTHGNTTLAQFQATQETKQGCTELHYQFRTSVTNNSGMLVLYADGPCSTDGKVLSISVQFLPCPPGFSFNSSDGTCGCEPRLKTYATRCNVTERALTREGDYWVGYNSHYQALILHPHCPFDYCKPATNQITFPLSNTDLQCENNRSGLLCGECKPGLSLALGSTKCLKCSNLHVLLLIPFALAGIALVLLLLVFKLTVAAGTINGLIFYANVVTVNRAIFFPPNQTNILTVFIAWLNLDFGIETCFFDGMDQYTKTWLQFLFPVYVWSLVGLIIIGCEYSSRIAKLFGSNPVAVLVTLFLLSYAKLLRTIITAMFFTLLDYPDEVQVAVWLYDANVQYFHGKHIILFLVASLILLFLFLPYTVILTVGQWLQAKSNGRCFYWINKPRIRPILDAYQAPYKDKHRYWTGLLLCFRCALFLVFAFNTRADPSLNLLAISSVAFGLTLVTRYTGAVYKRLYVDILEASFILNLGILAVATYYVKLAEVPVSQAAVAYTSVGIAFTTFIGVLLYHTYEQVWPKLQQRCMNKKKKSESVTEYIELESVDHKVKRLAPTVTVVERPTPRPLYVINNDSQSKQVRSWLLAPATKFSELREPLNLIDSDGHF